MKANLIFCVKSCPFVCPSSFFFFFYLLPWLFIEFFYSFFLFCLVSLLVCEPNRKERKNRF
jgi:hypothetical protein